MSNPTDIPTAMTLRGAKKKDDNGFPAAYSYKYITTQTTTLVKTGAGFLHSITYNGATSGCTIELDDAVTQTGPFAIITTPASPVTVIYDIAFTVGLSITTAVHNPDITVSYV